MKRKDRISSHSPRQQNKTPFFFLSKPRTPQSSCNKKHQKRNINSNQSKKNNSFHHGSQYKIKTLFSQKNNNTKGIETQHKLNQLKKRGRNTHTTSHTTFRLWVSGEALQTVWGQKGCFWQSLVGFLSFSNSFNSSPPRNLHYIDMSAALYTYSRYINSSSLISSILRCTQSNLEMKETNRESRIQKAGECYSPLW